MSSSDFETVFTEDKRAVTPVLGFVLLFGVLIMLLTMYQVQVVPQQNAQVEFQHFQTVQDDLIELRNSISTVGQADTPKFTRVKLGTTYQTRVATINPVAPAGTLRTSDPYNITVDNGTVSKNVSTRFLEYEPRYNEITTGSIWYEHSVLYIDERNEGPVYILEDQNLVTNRSNKLRLTAVQNEFEETSTQQTIIEVYPTENINESDLPDGELTVTIPTRLNESEYWGDQLGTDVDVIENYHGTGVHKLNLSNLSISSNNFEFNAVGIMEKPIADQPKQNVGPASQRNSGGGENSNENNQGDELPGDAVAYFDENGNGEYNQDVDTAYTVADLEGLSADGTVRVIKDVIMDDSSLSGISIDAELIVVEDNVEMRTTGGGQSIELNANTELRFTNAEIRTEGGGSDINLQAGTNLTADGATIEATGNGSEIDLSSTETMNVASTMIQSIAAITIDAGNELIADGATIETTGGGAEIELTSVGAMNIDSADIQSVAAITIDAGDELTADGATIEATGGGSDVTIDSGADITISNAAVEAINIELDSSGFIDLDRTSLAAASYGDLSADLRGNADLFVEDAEFTAGGSPTDLIYGPGNSINVIGEPAIGGTSS